MKNLLFVFSLSLLASSCAISYNMPDNRFETPEVAPQKTFKLSGAMGGAKDIELTPDFSSTWTNTANPQIGHEVFISGGLGYSIFDRMDVGLKYIQDTGIILSSKVQVIGKKGEKGFQLAGMIQGGSGGEDKSETSNTPTKIDLDNSFYGVDVILGFRFSHNFSIYTSAFKDNASYEVTQTRGTEVRSYKGESTNTGGNFGVGFDFSKNATLLLEFARAKAVSGDSRLTSSSFGASMNIFMF